MLLDLSAAEAVELLWDQDPLDRDKGQYPEAARRSYALQIGRIWRGSQAAVPSIRKIVVLVTEDWFALSHFRPLIEFCGRISSEVVVVTHSTGRAEEIEALGARLIPFNYARGGLDPAGNFAISRRLREIIDREDPDVVHAIALKPIMLAGLACSRHRALVVHLTGTGYLAIARSWIGRSLRCLVFSTLARLVSRQKTRLILENPDDLALLMSFGADPAHQPTIVGGAGVNALQFRALPQPQNITPVIAFAGRMIRSKGVGTLMAARDVLRSRGIDVRFELFGPLDTENRDAVLLDEIARWTQVPDTNWGGSTNDVREIWRKADICVVPSLAGEGMPRAMLEAAACARPLIVTDTPGCRHFVRNGIEGRVVPPGDPDALADAIAELVGCSGLRSRMGKAARARFESGYTERHVVAAYRSVYCHDWHGSLASNVPVRLEAREKSTVVAHAPRGRQMMKRSLDLAAAIVGLAVSLPLLIILGLLIRGRSRGPALFAQKRVGRHGGTFTCYKLRTMRADVGDLPTHTVDDNVVTPLGRILRRTKLDELPQLWNVLRGDMSLVGPRPCLPCQTELIFERQARGVLGARPGITGLAQINGCDMSRPKRLARWDAAYTRKSSLKLDLYILLRTIWFLTPRRRKRPSHRIDEFQPQVAP